jgi:tRNA modification GTPase
MEEVLATLKKIREKMAKLAASFHDGKKLHEGLTLCLAGPPNAGKSSLMNALLGKERAIVTDIPGTTRDLLEADLTFGSLNFRLVDTAGIRQTEEIIEQEGIARTRGAIGEADLVLLVLDATKAGDVAALIREAKDKKMLIVWNKIDLLSSEAPVHSTLPSVCVSAKERHGLEELKQKIDQLIWQNGLPANHKQALAQAIEALDALVQGLQMGTSPEFLASDMRKALNELGTIIGTNITEDILSAIFSKFCVGK